MEFSIINIPRALFNERRGESNESFRVRFNGPGFAVVSGRLTTRSTEVDSNLRGKAHSCIQKASGKKEEFPPMNLPEQMINMKYMLSSGDVLDISIDLEPKVWSKNCCWLILSVHGYFTGVPAAADHFSCPPNEHGVLVKSKNRSAVSGAAPVDRKRRRSAQAADVSAPAPTFPCSTSFEAAPAALIPVSSCRDDRFVSVVASGANSQAVNDVISSGTVLRRSADGDLDEESALFQEDTRRDFFESLGGLLPDDMFNDVLAAPTIRGAD